jgi:putative endonuclease
VQESKREKGRIGEVLAVDFLEKQGIKILTRNFQCPIGEIDLVAQDGRTLLFIEVKYRADASRGLPQESVTYAKQRKLTRLAQWYLKRYRLEGQPARFDVIAIIGDSKGPRINWIVNAFDARR